MRLWYAVIGWIFQVLRRKPRPFSPADFSKAMDFLGGLSFSSELWKVADLTTKGRMIGAFVRSRLPQLRSYDELIEELGDPHSIEEGGGHTYWIGGHVYSVRNPGWQYDLTFSIKNGEWSIFSHSDPRAVSWLEKRYIYWDRMRHLPNVLPPPTELLGNRSIPEQSLAETVMILNRVYRPVTREDIEGMEYDVEHELEPINVPYQFEWKAYPPYHFEVYVNLSLGTTDVAAAEKFARRLYAMIRYGFWGRSWIKHQGKSVELEFITIGSDEDRGFVTARIIVD